MLLIYTHTIFHIKKSNTNTRSHTCNRADNRLQRDSIGDEPAVWGKGRACGCGEVYVRDAGVLCMCMCVCVCIRDKSDKWVRNEIERPVLRLT